MTILLLNFYHYYYFFFCVVCAIFCSASPPFSSFLSRCFQLVEVYEEEHLQSLVVVTCSSFYFNRNWLPIRCFEAARLLVHQFRVPTFFFFSNFLKIILFYFFQKRKFAVGQILIHRNAVTQYQQRAYRFCNHYYALLWIIVCLSVCQSGVVHLEVKTTNLE